MSLSYRYALLALLMISGAAAAQDATAPAADAASAPAAEVASAPAAEVATAPAAEVAAAPAAEVAPAAVATNGLIGPAPADKGQVVFFRPSRMLGAAIGFKVREGETELGKLRSGKYFVALIEPGTHVYKVHGETKDELTLEVEAGETYYVQGTIGMGVIAGRPNLAPSDEATFSGMAGKLKLAK